MKKYLFVLTFAPGYLCQAMQAFTFASAHPKAPSPLIAMLDETSTYYQSLKSLEAHFQCTIEYNRPDGEKDVNTFKGIIKIRGKCYALEVPGQEIVNDGNTCWVYLKDNREVHVNDYNQEEDELNLARIYTIHREGYIPKRHNEITRHGVKYDVFVLEPNEKNTNIKEITVEIIRNTKAIHQWRIVTKEEDSVSTYRITKLIPNITLPPDYFNFDTRIPEGVEVINLRDE